jgi:septum formation protein
MRIILASKSPRRAKVLEKLGLTFEIVPSNFDEESVKEKGPLRLVERLALEKARVVAKENSDALIIGADTMMRLGDRVLGKPKNLRGARQILLESSGKTFNDFNGIAVIYNGQERSTAVTGTVKMKKYTNEDISNYFSRINPLDKAGGYAADPAEGGEFLESYQGEPGQELGLPIDSLKKFLKVFGVKF